MASFGVLIDPACTINSVDLKADLRGINIPLGTAGKDDTASGNASQLSKPGLKTAKMTLTFRQNFAAGAVNATLYPLWKNRTPFVASVRPSVGSAASATNPDISGTFFISSYDPLAANIGDEDYCKVELTQNLDDFAMTGL
jgi:hypothetical protein